MNSNEHVLYQQKPCVVLDAKSEGYTLPANLVLLQEEASHALGAGQVRHLAPSDEVDPGTQPIFPEHSPPE